MSWQRQPIDENFSHLHYMLPYCGDAEKHRSMIHVCIRVIKCYTSTFTFIFSFPESPFVKDWS